MAININKALDLQKSGLSGISVTAPVARVSRIYFNEDGLTATVLVDFYQDQASFDDPTIRAYESRSYNIDVPTQLNDALITKLKSAVADFDAVV